MKHALLTAAIVTAAATVSTPALAGPDPFVGEVMLFSGSFCPEHWLDADGRILPVRNYEVLYSILGPTYGGDGRTNFAIPDLRKAAPGPHLRYCIAVRGDYPRRP
ncbi:tail fiber protein [Sphingomonas sp. KR3-1]|uniref:phage tail protein n=1 Tax=Sphingomonas sp. KR3-1 TaxID=3156611 RepID=UPI0032B40270